MAEPTDPSPSLPLPAPSPILSTQINLATRVQHIRLNQLIVSRLKLALPPKTNDPLLLGYGLAAFARIYYTLEEAWDGLEKSVDVYDSVEGSHDAQVRAWLAYLRPDGLARTARLQDDLRFFALHMKQDIELDLPYQRKVLQRMRASFAERPHLLVAYAWVMYMAIFSGGRWIRQQLIDAGEDFWMGGVELTQLEKQPTYDAHGYSFLKFDGEQDGEDIKTEFKARLLEAETLLTIQEREEVVATAVELFEDCISLVQELDRTISWHLFRDKFLPMIFVSVLVFLVFVVFFQPEWLRLRFSALME